MIYKNPVLTRLAGRRRWPPLRACFWLAFVCGLFSLAISTWAFLKLPVSLALAWYAITAGLTALGVTLAAPVLTALFAAIVTGRDVKSESFVLLQATTITDRDLVAGYVYAVLYQTRVWPTWIVGLFPAAVISLWQSATQVVAVFVRVFEPGPGGGAVQYKLLLTPPAAVYPTSVDALAWLAMVVGLWGMNWVGAALGVAIALWRRGFGLSAVAAPTLTLVIMLGALWRFATLPYWKDTESLFWGLAMLVSYPLAFLLTRFSERWVRKT